MSVVLLRPARWAVLCGALPCAALAGPARYDCPPPHTLSATFTPRDANVTFDGQRHTLRRVRDSGEARFVNRQDGLTLVLAGSQARWLRAGEAELACRKVVGPLAPEALQGGGRPAPSAPAH
ncbi:hypothetical protein KGA65_01555 [Ideonella sp. B7]|uniref:hypothetical protein n=1 Tax=Ideonella benzenivorans TaxID=2831643 RepID=UPI001CECA0DB|nr:hypothetical protein [Ideonella benzenivorans]MCA6215216.1 hypothetical protein [Ideonella benzenivorans]